MIPLLLLIALLPVFAQETLNLRRAVDLALERNRELERLRREIHSLEDVYRAERWERFAPRVDLLVDREGFTLLSGALLLDFGNRLARIRSAEIAVKIKKELLQELERQVKIRLVKLFMDLYMAEKTAEVRREEMAVAYVRFDRERERLSRGLSDRVKVAEWEKRYRAFRAELLSAQRRYNETLLEIKRFVGLDVETYVDVDLSDLLSFRVPVEKTVSVEHLLSGLEGNYLLRVKELEIAYFRSRAQEQKRILYPELSVYLNLRSIYEEADRFRSGWNLILRLPLFDGRASFFREKSFRDLARAVEVEREDLYQKLKRRALEAVYRWEELVGEYQSALAFDSWAQENLDLSRSSYELELAFDLGYAMSTKTEAERKVAEAKFRLILFLMRLYDLTGEDPLRVFSEEPPFLTERVGEI